MEGWVENWVDHRYRDDGGVSERLDSHVGGRIGG